MKRKPDKIILSTREKFWYRAVQSGSSGHGSRRERIRFEKFRRRAT